MEKPLATAGNCRAPRRRAAHRKWAGRQPRDLKNAFARERYITQVFTTAKLLDTDAYHDFQMPWAPWS
jgi:hypothetical protein